MLQRASWKGLHAQLRQQRQVRACEHSATHLLGQAVVDKWRDGLGRQRSSCRVVRQRVQTAEATQRRLQQQLGVDVSHANLWVAHATGSRAFMSAGAQIQARAMGSCSHKLNARRAMQADAMLSHSFPHLAGASCIQLLLQLLQQLL